MEPNARFRSNVRTFYAWVGSMVVFIAAPFVTVRLIDYGTTLSRAAAVVAGVGAMVPWMWVAVIIVRRGDEFIQRVHLVACTIAFGGAILLIVTLAMLVRAGFIAPPDLMLVLLGCLVVWFLALMGAKLHFERSR